MLSSAFASGNTRITVASVADATPDGTVVAVAAGLTPGQTADIVVAVNDRFGDPVDAPAAPLMVLRQPP